MTAVAFRARRIPAVELERRLALPAALQEASAILAEASARAAQTISDARAEAGALVQAARLEASAVAVAEAEAERRRIAASEVRDLASAAARLEARFDAMTPWLEALVGQIVTRIIGSYALEEQHRMLLTEALAASRPAGNLRLRVAPGSLAAAVAGCSGLAGDIPVVADPSLPEGGCVLDCEGGLLDLSVAAQVDALVEALSPVFQGHAP